ncbi:Calmodulin-binding protein 60 B like [Actinidia chinensis var. chinensis]|uniref:Calmodulin-binding protein 60 B like n=1 Tax=Actinidia chinensis var. chinensis TaxID=1590841 RepID=A0A2R6R353_ACTCC|nr:Calmodulin-binding protein 60 B like [Actinidia chinensis var. chinensis]
MVPKRFFSDVEDNVPNREPKRRVTFATIAKDVMEGLSTHKFVTTLEPLLRSVVREEVEHAVRSFNRPCPRSSVNQPESSQAIAWKLHFVNKLPSTLFTGSRVESEDSKRIKIVILDVISQKIVTSGPLSSIKIEILALNGDFGTDDQEDWSESDFSLNVVRQREGKRPLVIGELETTLKDGVGYVGDVSFTDNSSWIRSRKFRLGARNVSTAAKLRIREARSEAFVVKDHRGESYKKHHPPNLDDEVWRLERISKGGQSHTKLTAMGITTVKDFLKLHSIDPTSLRNVIGGGISNKIWDTIIEHANECVLDEKRYLYYKDAEKVGLLFNSIFKVVEVIFDGQSYHSLDKLSPFQMGLVKSLKRDAYKNLNDLVPFDPPSAVGPSILSSSLLADPYSSSISDLQNVNYSGMHQDQLEMQLAPNHMTMTPSPLYTCNVQDGSHPEVSVAQLCHPVQVFGPTLRNDFMTTDYISGPYVGETSWAASGSLNPVMQIGHLTTGDNSQAGTSTWPGNIGIFSPDFGIHLSKKGKPKARWCMIRAAMKLGLSVRRDAAAKRNRKTFLPTDFLDWSC